MSVRSWHFPFPHADEAFVQETAQPYPPGDPPRCCRAVGWAGALPGQAGIAPSGLGVAYKVPWNEYMEGKVPRMPG